MYVDVACMKRFGDDRLYGILDGRTLSYRNMTTGEYRAEDPADSALLTALVEEHLTPVSPHRPGVDSRSTARHSPAVTMCSAVGCVLGPPFQSYACGRWVDARTTSAGGSRSITGSALPAMAWIARVATLLPNSRLGRLTVVSGGLMWLDSGASL